MKKKIISYWLAAFSVIIGLTLIILIINVNIKFIPFIRLSTSIYFVPKYISFIGIVLAIMSIIIKKSKCAYLGLFINTLLIVLMLLFSLVGLRYVVH